jgi:hypothetical protein
VTVISVHTQRPPPPHDPEERELVLQLDGWECRQFPETDPKRHYFRLHGLCHIQLWHPAQRVSILTPSKLTQHQLELFPIAGWKHRVRHYDELVPLLESEHAILPPTRVVFRALMHWFVLAEYRESAPLAENAQVQEGRQLNSLFLRS